MSSIYLDDHDYRLGEEEGDMMTEDVYDSMPASPVATSPSGGNGLGSLADELAAAYDSEEEEDEYEGEDGSGAPPQSATTPTSAVGMSNGHKKKHSRSASSASITKVNNATTTHTKKGSINGTATAAASATGAAANKGSKNNSNMTSEIPASLQEKLDQVEAEALKGLAMVKHWKNKGRTLEVNGYRTEKKPPVTNGTGPATEEEEDDVRRLMKGLQDLKSQSSIETGSQRLITAHSSLSSHVANQTRNLRDLSSFLSTPVQALYPMDDFSTEHVAEASELLTSLLDLVPQPTPLPLHELNQLHAMTLSLITQLSFLSDSLYMARQQNNVAGRKLRGVKEACREWRNEIDEFERARQFIEEGNWDTRLKQREAEGVCRDVMHGFEDFCKGMERRIEGFC